jgi:hypothetical protein
MTDCPSKPRDWRLTWSAPTAPPMPSPRRAVVDLPAPAAIMASLSPGREVVRGNLRRVSGLL